MISLLHPREPEQLVTVEVLLRLERIPVLWSSEVIQVVVPTSPFALDPIHCGNG